MPTSASVAQPSAPSSGTEESVQYTTKQATSSGVEYNCFLVRSSTHPPVAACVHVRPKQLLLLPHACAQVCGSVFECPALYLPLKPIGKGAYGVVW